MVVIVVVVRLLIGLLPGRSTVDIWPGITANIRGRRSPATGTAVRPVILVVDDGYDNGLVVAILVLQQAVDNSVYVAIRIGAAGLQRNRVRFVAVALFVGISRRKLSRRRRRTPGRPPGRARSIRRGGRRMSVLRGIFRSGPRRIVFVLVVVSSTVYRILLTIAAELGIRSPSALRRPLRRTD